MLMAFLKQGNYRGKGNPRKRYQKNCSMCKLAMAIKNSLNSNLKMQISQSDSWNQNLLSQASFPLKTLFLRTSTQVVEKVYLDLLLQELNYSCFTLGSSFTS